MAGAKASQSVARMVDERDGSSAALKVGVMVVQLDC